MSVKKISRFHTWRIFLSAVSAFFSVCPTAQALVQSVGPEGINARLVNQQDITGKGIRIGLLSSGNVRAAHEAFAIPDGQRAVNNYDFTGNGLSVSAHDTHVAGIIISRGGAGYAECQGGAPCSLLSSARISDGSISASTVERALRELIVRQGCRILVTGVQLSSQSAKPDGNSVWAKLYDYYAERHDVIFANAAGNSESAVTVFGDGFNGITTGGLALDEHGRWNTTGSISNSGPTMDGRRKPELMAPVQRQMVPGASSNTAWNAVGSSAGETSYAAPHTAAAAALLTQYASQTATPYDDKSLTIKAVLINTADPNLLGKDNRLTDPSAVLWDPDRGYGRLDAGHAFDLLRAKRVRPGKILLASQGWAYETLNSQERTIFQIKGKKGQELIVTAVWHRKLWRTGILFFTEEVPRLNLLLELQAPDGTTMCADSERDDNVRKVRVKLPEEGVYTVVVQNKNRLKNRDYAVAFELVESPLPNGMK